MISVICLRSTFELSNQLIKINHIIVLSLPREGLMLYLSRIKVFQPSPLVRISDVSVYSD